MINEQEANLKKLPLTSDYVFKRIFGQEENKEALKDFLESILKIKIEKVEINNPEIPKDFYDSKYGMLDLKVTLDNQIIVNVEMQVQNQHNIEQRSTYYMTSVYSQQIGESEPYTNCKKVIVINILNFNYYRRNSYHSIARMKFEKNNQEEYVDMGYKNEDEYATDYIEMHIIELQKFKKKNPKIDTKLEQWLWLFIGGEEEKMRRISKKNREIEKINKKLASMSLSREERNNYEFRKKAILDEVSAIDYATKKGLAQGIEQGIQQGIEQGLEQGIEQGKEQGVKEGTQSIAKEMLKKNMDINLIMELTKLTKEEIEKIKKDI